MDEQREEPGAGESLRPGAQESSTEGATSVGATPDANLGPEQVNLEAIQTQAEPPEDATMTGTRDQQLIQEAVENSKEITEQLLKTAIAARKLEEVKTLLQIRKEALAIQREIDELDAEATERENARNARGREISEAQRPRTMPIRSREPSQAPSTGMQQQQAQEEDDVLMPDAEATWKKPKAVELEEKVPAAPQHIKPFTASTTEEWDLFESSLDIHFEQHNAYFKLQHRRVLQASTHLEGKLKVQWRRHVRELEKKDPDRKFTWQEFSDWCHNLIADPVTRQTSMLKQWHVVQQRYNQSVVEYSAHLTNIHAQLLVQPDEYWRTKKLVMTVVQELQNELRDHPVQGKTYEATLQHLQALESRMPTRQQAIKKGKLSKDPQQNKQFKGAEGYEHTRGKPRAGKYSTPYPPGQGTKRKHNGQDLKCFLCQKKGHFASECRSRSKQADVNSQVDKQSKN
ncbi:hypothetical protein N7486_003268 [Penicillium sp. IBT 16267x]|nr:hypothetical protein N7486_003268 [Penicillium sp. IBT 16267x]